MNTSIRYSSEVRQRAVCMVLDHEHSYPSQCATIESIAENIGCTRETLRRWVRQHEHDKGRKDGSIHSDPDRIKELERENRERQRSCNWIQPVPRWVISIGPVNPT